MCLLVSLFASKLRNEQRKFLQQKERDKTCRRNRCGDFREKTRVAGMLLHVGKQLWWRPSSNQHLSVLTLLPSHLYLKAMLPGSCSTPVHLHTSFGCTSSSLCRGALRGCSRNSDDILTCTYLMRAFAGAPCSFRYWFTSQLAFAFFLAALVVHKLIACVGIVNMLLLRDRLYTYGV
jgi:hypothetical protein